MQVRILIATAAVAVTVAAPAAAQSTSGVSGSDVKAGENLFEYRFAYAAEDDGKDEAFAHRFHYQHGFSDSWRGRILLTMGNAGGDALKAQTASVEILHQFKESEDTGGWDSALRLDGNIPLEDGRPGRARIAWHNAYEFENHVELRGVVLFGHEFGDRAKDGVSIETREEVTYKLPSGLKIGAQMFDNYGTTDQFGSFDAQKHQLGPVIKGKLGEHMKYEFSTLFGLSRAASDADFRFFVSYAL